MQKWGKKESKQNYKCQICKYSFIGKSRQKKSTLIKQLYSDYSLGKQTLKQLQNLYGKTPRTIRKYFDAFSPCIGEIVTISKPINLIFDTTFFGRNYGILVFRADRRNVYWKEVDNEKLVYLEESFTALDFCGFLFKSFTIDGRKGVSKYLEKRYPNIPIQFCHFHQRAIIRRYLTNNPKTNCGIELKKLMQTLAKADRSTFTKAFDDLRERYTIFLKERNENNQFRHRRIRSAFRSIRTNLHYLFTFKDYPSLNIPNTTNSCDGSFAHWKQKIKIHRGLAKHRRRKMINYLLENS